MPTVFRGEFLIPCHHPESAFREFKALIKNRKIFRVLLRCGSRQTTDGEPSPTALGKRELDRIDIVSGDEPGNLAVVWAE